MEEYHHLYYALFNQISDVILQIENNSFSKEEIILKLREIQSDAEERFIVMPESMSWEDYCQKERLIMNNGIMELLLDTSMDYSAVPESAYLISELKKIMTETSELLAEYLEHHKDEVKIRTCR